MKLVELKNQFQLLKKIFKRIPKTLPIVASLFFSVVWGFSLFRRHPISFPDSEQVLQLVGPLDLQLLGVS